MLTRNVIPLSANIRLRVLRFLEWINTRYRCMTCDQNPSHEPGCEFYALLQDLRAKMERAT